VWYIIAVRLLLIAMAVSIWVSAPHVAAPKEQVIQSEGPTSAKQPDKTKQRQESADSEAIKTAISQIQQQNAEIRKDQKDATNQDVETQRKLVKYTGALVWVGALQGLVLLLTVGAIYYQARIMKRQAQDAAIDTRRLNRAYLTVDVWMPEPGPLGGTGVMFRIYNPSRTAARIEAIAYETDCFKSEFSIGAPGGRMLTPREGHWHSIMPAELFGPEGEVAPVFKIRGKITYTDIFRRKRHRTFAKICVMNGNTATFSDVDGAGWNTEEEWDKDD
jgi:hypothetical protein